MSSAASTEVHVPDVSITATARHGNSSNRPSRLGAIMADSNADSDMGASRASSLTSTSPPLSPPPPQMQLAYSQFNRKPNVHAAPPDAAAPTRVELPNLDWSSIPPSTVQQPGCLQQSQVQQQSFAASASTDVNRMSDSRMEIGRMEMRAAPSAASGMATATAAHPAGMDAQSRVEAPGSPQFRPRQHLSLLASVSSTDACRSFDQTPDSRSPHPSHTPMDARPSAESTTTTATRAATPSAAGTASGAFSDAANETAAAREPLECTSIRASSLPDAPAQSCLSSASPIPILNATANLPFPRPISGIDDEDEDAAMDTGSEDNDRGGSQPPVSAASTQAYEGSDRVPRHTRTLSDSQIEPIRSLTGLALSSTSPQRPRRQPLSLHAQRDRFPQDSSVEGYAGPAESATLQQILARMDDIQRYCVSLVQMQEQQAEQISSLEAAIRQHSLPTHPHAAAAAGGSTAAPAAPGPPASGPVPPRPLSAALAQPPALVPSGVSSDETIEGGIVLPGAASPGGIPRLTSPHALYQSQHISEHSATRAERRLHHSTGEPTHRHHYHHYGHSQQRYSYPTSAAVPAGHQGTSPGYRHLHQSRAAPYSTRTSPTMPPARVQSPPAGRAARGPQLSTPAPPQTTQAGQASQARRESMHRPHNPAPATAWAAGGARGGNPSFAGAGVDERAQYASAGSSAQPHLGPHGLSAAAFGYPVPSGSATAPSAGMAEPFGGPLQQPMAAAGFSAARMKRARMAEGAGEPAAAAGPGEGAYAHASLQQQHYHMLPPIRAGGMARGAADPRAAALPRAGGAPGSLQLIRPDAVVATRGARAGKDKGKAAAVHLAGGASGAGRALPGGNPEALPTAAWLSGQRSYKNSLLHLLSLESFYPSDVAMLNTFRLMGDFTNDQVEANAASLMSWARGWLRYNRNAVLRSTLENKAKASLAQLAEALQHDLHTDVDFTTPENIRRVALLRLIYYQWQAENKLGTKSQSMYRDYETRLREIEASSHELDREREWKAILDEENSRRMALIRESRGSGSAILPRPEQQQQQQSQDPVTQQQQQRISTQTPQPQQPHPPQVARRQSMELQSRSGVQTPIMGQTHFYQQTFQQQQQQLQQQYRRSVVPMAQFATPQSPLQRYSHPAQVYSQQDLAHAFQATQQRHHTAAPGPMEADAWPASGGSGEGMRATGKDDTSEVSVDLSPEP